MSRELQNTSFNAYRPAFLLGGLVSGQTSGRSARTVTAWSEDRVETRWVERKVREEKARVVRALFRRVIGQ
ncbi:hypothetical protein E4656_19790 [Natronospirillum operosum]|uniref:Uncharacterized protein n=1 Tax=Natronospirillum operosum TaxID=2759953 RepID=A0A4Z0W631_9GAMM|nr:hypothetical protein [Natronospirillum operosum]TGG89982.1 hypothetical protein E4656_19790 [Natronospirillum operosum]